MTSEELKSTSGTYKLILQPDGNLVVMIVSERPYGIAGQPAGEP